MTIRRASKPANWDALVYAVIREDRDAWREAKRPVQAASRRGRGRLVNDKQQSSPDEAVRIVAARTGMTSEEVLAEFQKGRSFTVSLAAPYGWWSA